MGNKIAGSMGGMIETISTQYSLSTFFMIFTGSVYAIGFMMILLTPVMKKLMHGVSSAFYGIIFCLN
jgi:POT family proton-dependent oligopeptide transporter